jgi:hypothetical protein
MRGCVRLVSLLLLLSGCDAGAPSLLVDVRADYVAGIEITGIEAELEGRVMAVVVRRGDDLVNDTRRVASFEGLTSGTHSLAVRLLDSDGVLVERDVSVDVRQPIGITVVFTRSCSAVVCPRADPTATACLAGRCVPPECTDGTQPICGESEVCTTASDCSSDVACAEARCEGGVCLFRGVDESCGTGMFCDPDRGCIDAPIEDGGVADSAADTGPIDSGADASIDAADAGDAGCAACTATRYDEVGSGTTTDPYQLATAAQWIDLASRPEGWSLAFRLVRDIDLGGISGDHPPIGTESMPFTGNMDGNGKVVRRYTNVGRATYTGLFGHVAGATASISDLAVENAVVDGGERSGALIGFLAVGTVERVASFGPSCHVTAGGRANHRGGLVGETASASSLRDVFSTCRVSGMGIGVAGLVGHHEGSLDHGYYVNETDPVTASNRVAGLLGWNDAAGRVNDTFTVASVVGDSINDDVALNIGTLSGTAIGTYFDSSQSVTNLDTGGITVNGTAVDRSSAPGYFHDATNPPLSAWDFSTIWVERTGAPPTLWFLDR